METTVEILNDLIKINSDRAGGFRKAANGLGAGDNDLRTLFNRFSQQSSNNIFELVTEVSTLGGGASAGSGAGGTLHRAWIDVKALFTGHGRRAILEECERGEDAIRKAYSRAVLSGNLFSPEPTAVLGKQQAGINEAHGTIKGLRGIQQVQKLV